MSELIQLDLFANPVYWQVLVNGVALHPANEPAYRFDSYAKALAAVDMCYGVDSLKYFTQIKEVLEYTALPAAA